MVVSGHTSCQPKQVRSVLHRWRVAPPWAEARGRGSARPICRMTISCPARSARSEEHTSELQSLMRISYAVFCLKKKKKQHSNQPFHSTKKRHNSNTHYQ